MERLDREQVWVLMLNVRNHLIHREVISVGSLDTSVVHPREIFKNCIRRSAAAVILAHNHPSGDAAPSDDDIRMTKRIIEAGKIVGITVLDHVILDGGRLTEGARGWSLGALRFELRGEWQKVQWLFKYVTRDIAIDLGTANTLVHVRGKGIVLVEPSVVAIHAETKELLAVGTEAKQMIGRTPGNIIAIRPMKDGVIADFDVTQMMMHHFIRKAYRRGLLKPRVIVAVPSGCTEVERRAVLDGAQSGCQEAYTIEEPMAAAIGGGLPVDEPTGNMIVDIGGGTSEVAVISLEGIVASRSIRVGGDEMDEAVVNYVKRAYNLLIGERTAEEVKTTIGSASELEQEETMDIRGRDLVTGLPRTITVDSREIRKALSEPVNAILEAVKETLENTPPVIAADIMDRGIVMTGGGSMLKGLDRLISSETGMPVHTVDEPLYAVVRGAESFEEIDTLRKVLASSKRR